MNRTAMRQCGARWPTEADALHSKRFLSGGYELADSKCGCGGVHLAKVALAPRVVKAAARKDTGPSRSVRAMVLERDQCQCCACGKPVGMPGTWWSIQHRVARGQGGGNDFPNLVTLCGSATSPGCHRLAEDRDREMHDMGFWLRSDEDPAQVPIMLTSEHGSGITVWLTRDGGYALEAPEVAA